MYRASIRKDAGQLIVRHARPVADAAGVEMDEGRSGGRVKTDAATLQPKPGEANLLKRHVRDVEIHRMAEHVLAEACHSRGAAAEHGVGGGRTVGRNDLNRLLAADIEKRGNGDDASGLSKAPNLLARLFGTKSNDEEDEGMSAPAPRISPGATKMTEAKSTEARPGETRFAEAKATEVPKPRARPVGSTLQLASADVQETQPAKPKQGAATAEKAEPKSLNPPLTPADIINARGLWDDAPATPKQASPEQVAALRAREALASVSDVQSTASAPAAYQALAYAPAAASSADRANVVTASAPVPRSARPASTSRNSMAPNEVTTVVGKGAQGQSGVVATSTRIAASRGSDSWMRVMMLAPSASTSMSVTLFGDADLTSMSAHFVKPQSTIAMGFSDDPLMGLTCDQFTGSATVPLTTQSFVMRTALLH